MESRLFRTERRPFCTKRRASRGETILCGYAPMNEAPLRKEGLPCGEDALPNGEEDLWSKKRGGGRERRKIFLSKRKRRSSQRGRESVWRLEPFMGHVSISHYYIPYHPARSNPFRSISIFNWAPISIRSPQNSAYLTVFSAKENDMFSLIPIQIHSISMNSAKLRPFPSHFHFISISIWNFHSMKDSSGDRGLSCASRREDTFVQRGKYRV